MVYLLFIYLFSFQKPANVTVYAIYTPCINFSVKRTFIQ